MARFGVSVADVLSLISDSIGGVDAGEVIDGNRRYDIYVRMDRRFRDSPEAISRLILPSESGAWVRLGDVAKIEMAQGALQVRRDQLQRRAVVQFNVADRDLGRVVADVQTRLNSEIGLPAGYALEIDGLYLVKQQAERYLSWVVPLTLIACAFVLSIGFSAWNRVLLILLTVPFSLSGGVLALLATGLNLSLPGLLGFVIVFGIGLLNATIMVNAMDHAKSPSQQRKTPEEIIAVAVQRLRPILMTALTTVLGLLPLLLATGTGAEMQRPLAVVVVGGILASTLLTLFAIPVFYLRWIVKVDDNRS